MSPVLVCAGGGEGVWAEPGCSPLSPLSSVCVPAVSQLPGMSRLRRVSSLQSPAPIHNIVEFSNSDLHVHDTHNVRRRCTSPLLYVLVSHFTNLIQVFTCTQSLLLKLGTFPAKCQKFKPSLNIMNKVLFLLMKE